MKNPKLYVALAAFALFGYFVVWPLIPHGATLPTTSVAADARITYICTETGSLTIAAPQPWPAVNPATGRRTLSRALYCPQCNTWRPAPSPEGYTGNPLALKCPRHGVVMTAEGPE